MGSIGSGNRVESTGDPYYCIQKVGNLGSVPSLLYTSPEGIEHAYSYDKLGRSTTLTFAGKTVSLTYEKTRLKQVGYPNGVTTSYSYNVNHWLTSMATIGPQGTVLSRGYSFDNVGNITGKESEHGPSSYGYDATYQLTSADHPQLTDEAFTYDAVGNRLSSLDVTGALSYNANNELIGHSVVTYEYDANGNTVKKIERTGSVQVPVLLETRYQYNARNRLEKVYLPDGRVASYAYDPFGRRVSKQVGNDATYFAYADEGLVGEYGASGTMEKVYGWKPDSLWGTDPLYLVEGGNTYFYHNDHLGTPQMLTDINGAVVWSASYAVFGSAIVDPSSTVTNNLRFPGQYLDAETGLHYNFQRTYDPISGRYTQVDPIGFESGDFGLFKYANNGPIVMYDPLGLLTEHGGLYYDDNGNIIGERELEAPFLDPIDFVFIGGGIVRPLVKQLAMKSAEKFVKLATIRAMYNEEVKNIPKIAKKMLEEGICEEKVARFVSGLRRDLGIKYKNMTPIGKRLFIYIRNITPKPLGGKGYDTIYGPTVEWYLKQKFTWRQIIEKAAKTSDKYNKKYGG